jgi:hypothetical protein
MGVLLAFAEMRSAQVSSYLIWRKLLGGHTSRARHGLENALRCCCQNL